MAREISARYADTQAFASDLRAYLEGRVVRAYEAGTWAETRKWVQRNKSLAASLAAAIVILFAGVVASTTFAKLATDKGRIATQRAEDVLSLSASKDLAELVERAEKLWPASPEMVPAYEAWITDAHALIEGRPGNAALGIKKRPSLAEHKAKLVELCQRARRQTEEEIKAEQESHPRFQELTRKRAELTWRSQMLGLEPWPSELEVNAQLAKETLPTDSDGLNTLRARPKTSVDAPSDMLSGGPCTRTSSTYPTNCGSASSRCCRVSARSRAAADLEFPIASRWPGSSTACAPAVSGRHFRPTSVLDRRAICG
jgi:hypothetical protein